MITKPIKKKETDFMDLVMTYHKHMAKNNLHLIYEGEINQSITKTLTSLAEQNLNEENEDKRVVRIVYHVMVECLQNIYKHNDPDTGSGPGKRSYGIILIAHHKNGYVVSTGNNVRNSIKTKLIKILDRINSLSIEELNEVYKKQIKDGVLSKKGGAGLGFVDIGRKTGENLEYKFESIDEKNSFFILKTYIAK